MYKVKVIIVLEFGSGNLYSCGSACSALKCVSQSIVDQVPLFMLCRVFGTCSILQ